MTLKNQAPLALRRLRTIFAWPNLLWPLPLASSVLGTDQKRTTAIASRLSDDEKSNTVRSAMPVLMAAMLTRAMLHERRLVDLLVKTTVT